MFLQKQVKRADLNIFLKFFSVLNVDLNFDLKNFIVADTL